MLALDAALGGRACQVATREYRTWRSFLADLELIFSNARQFNRPAHPVHKAANDLQQKCLKFLEERDGAALEKTAREVSSRCHIAPGPFSTDLRHPFLSCWSQFHQLQLTHIIREVLLLWLVQYFVT